MTYTMDFDRSAAKHEIFSSYTPNDLFFAFHNSRTRDGNTALHIALAECDYLMAGELLRVGIDPNQKNGEDLTPMQVAVRDNNSEGVFFLFHKGCDTVIDPDFLRRHPTEACKAYENCHKLVTGALFIPKKEALHAIYEVCPWLFSLLPELAKKLHKESEIIALAEKAVSYQDAKNERNKIIAENPFSLYKRTETEQKAARKLSQVGLFSGSKVPVEPVTSPSEHGLGAGVRV